jgi:hypothetical protein
MNVEELLKQEKKKVVLVGETMDYAAWHTMCIEQFFARMDQWK